MLTTTTFDTAERYVFLQILVKDIEGEWHEVDALLDTGAPRTEFSGEMLYFLGFLEKTDLQQAELKSGLQTQKYGKVKLPHLEVCSHSIKDLEVYVSHFEKSWGIKALIGLDFFRRCKVTVDYSKGQIVSEMYKN